MGTTSPADQALCDEVRARGVRATPRGVSTLREYGVLEASPNKGGRGRVTCYVPGTADIVAAIEEAKSDPDYRRKLHRAVLFAWVRGASVGTSGLRWAYREHFREEERQALNRVNAKRVDDDDWMISPKAKMGMAKARIGERLLPDEIRAMGEDMKPWLLRGLRRQGMLESLPASVEQGSQHVSPTLSTIGESERILDLASQRTDGSIHVLPVSNDLIAALPAKRLAQLTRTAPREELDAARDHARPLMLAHGFSCSDLTVAYLVPAMLDIYR